MAVREPTTTGNLALPIRTAGHVALQQSFKTAMQLIDNAVTALQGGSGILAAEIVYDPGESNSAEDVASVQAALDDIYNRLIRVEGRVDSNSAG